MSSMSMFDSMCRFPDAGVTPETRLKAFAELELLYSQIPEFDFECRQCGKCCHFVDYQHLLFTTPVEVDYLLKNTDFNKNIDANVSCPWQDGTSCTAHIYRLIGCRFFFCDSENDNKMQALHSKYISKVKIINHNAGYIEVYAPLGKVLEGFLSS